MIPSFIIHLGDINPAIQKSNRLPKEVSYRIPYAQVDSWYDDKNNWSCIQWHNAKHVYLYSIEIQTTERRRIAVEINHPDIHWQYALKGGYSLPDLHDCVPVLQEGYKQMLRGAPGDLQVEVGKGRHWIVGFNVAASWLGRYPEDLFIGEQYISQELESDILYQSIPIPITDLDRAELYYLLGLSPSQHILQDSQIYLPISKLVEQMQTLDDATLSPIQNKVQAVKHYIQQCITTNEKVPTISALADHFCVDKDYLGRMYRSTEKESLAYYIYRLKQKRAAELLLNKVAISCIAEQLGYSDSAAFRKAFKKYHGMYPSAYLRTKH